MGIEFITYHGKRNKNPREVNVGATSRHGKEAYRFYKKNSSNR